MHPVRAAFDFWPAYSLEELGVSQGHAWNSHLCTFMHSPPTPKLIDNPAYVVQEIQSKNVQLCLLLTL